MTQSLLTPIEFRAHQAAVLAVLRQIRDYQKEPPRRSDLEAVDELLIRVVQVNTAGTIVQGPNVKVPKGYRVAIRQRRHTGTPTGYFAGSRNAIANNLERSELADADSVTVSVSNLNKLWFDGTAIPTGGLFFELIVEL